MKLTEINPNFTDAYHDRGLAKVELEDYKGAIQDFNKAIELEYIKLNLAYNNRGAAKRNLKDYRGAIEDYTKAIGINPNYANAYYNRGAAKISLGQKDNGCLDFSKARELGFAGAYGRIRKLCN